MSADAHGQKADMSGQVFQRYAIYAVPDGVLHEKGAAWLGWDAVAGGPVRQPAVPNIARITQAPRRYGFHGTIKAPFRIAAGESRATLLIAARALCAASLPVALPPLDFRALGRFLALVPSAPCPALDLLASTVVTSLDRFRAPLADEERAKRGRHLSDRQRAHLETWGYPHVLEDFRFHLTLTGRVPQEDHPALLRALRAHFGGTEEAPMRLTALCLMGEEEDGAFHLVKRLPLGQT